jgi:TIR domain
MATAPKIYVSSRRDDSAAVAGRIADRLVARFGAENVFFDISILPAGHYAKKEVVGSDVVFAVIGPRWSDEIRDRYDVIGAGLQDALSFGKPVIPILVNDASMPRPDDLPPKLRHFANRQAATVGLATFHADVDRLIQATESLLERSGAEAKSIITKPKSDQIPGLNVADLQVNRVFVSHATADRKWVEQEIVAFLNTKGLTTWYSKKSIASASQWEREIKKGLESCDWFAIVISPASSQSEWVKDELNWAFYHRPTRIIPIIMERCNLWDFHIRLPRLQYVDFTEDKQDAQQLLMNLFSEARAAESAAAHTL